MAKLTSLEDAAKAFGSRPRIESFESPKWGIPQDQSSDCAPAINAMLASVPPGTAIYVPGKTYMVKTPVIMRDGVEIFNPSSQLKEVEWGGQGIPLIKADAPMGAVITDAGGTLNKSGINGVNISGGNFAKRGVYWHMANSCIVANCQINVVIDEYIVIDDGSASSIDNVQGLNGMQGTYTSDVASFDLGGYDQYITRVEVSGNPATWPSWKSSGHQIGIRVRGTNAFIDKCVSEFFETGVKVTGNLNHITSVRADHVAGHGWVIDGGSNGIVGCSVDRAGQHTAATYSAFQVTGFRNIVSAPHVDMASGSLKYIYEDGSAGGTALAMRNEWTGLGACPDYTDSFFKADGWAGSAPQLSRHVQRPPAGANVIDVTNAGIILLDSGGSSVNLDTIKGGSNGQVIDVISHGGYTLKSWACKTRTGADMPMPAGLPITLVFVNDTDGGTWYMRG